MLSESTLSKIQKACDKPLSRFIEFQGETWHDHDFIEMGFDENAKSITELVGPYSWSQFYALKLQAIVKKMGIKSVILLC